MPDEKKRVRSRYGEVRSHAGTPTSFGERVAAARRRAEGGDSDAGDACEGVSEAPAGDEVQGATAAREDETRAEAAEPCVQDPADIAAEDAAEGREPCVAEKTTPARPDDDEEPSAADSPARGAWREDSTLDADPASSAGDTVAAGPSPRAASRSGFEADKVQTDKQAGDNKPHLPAEPHYQQRPEDVSKQRRGSAVPWPWVVLAVVLVAAALVLVIGFRSFAQARADRAASEAAASAAAASAASAEAAAAAQARTVSFVAVGDNLPDDALGAYADAQAGSVGDGAYDYRPLYAPVRDYISAADLAYVDEEVCVGGDDIGPKGYPSFNAPDDLADSLVDVGFDLVGTASNHVYDFGPYHTIEHSCAVWDDEPVVYAGTATSEAEASQLRTVERNGITFAFLDYTYGLNGYDRDDVPSYAVSFLDEQKVTADVQVAKQAADVVIVAAHWGTENRIKPDDDEVRWAQLFADLGVDVVLGSHPHVIQPLTWVTGSGGNRTLVAYSLGNFVSKHKTPDPLNELEGMLSCDFVRTDDGVSIEDVTWTPLVNHTEEGAYAVYALKDYSADLAARHTMLGQADPSSTDGMTAGLLADKRAQNDTIAQTADATGTSTPGWLAAQSDSIVNMLGDDFALDSGPAADDITRSGRQAAAAKGAS